MGLIKIDVPGLRMLSAIAEACALISQQIGKPFSLDHLTFDDPAVYEMVTAADTVGIFQVESRAQTQVLPRLRPTCFNDLIVSISLIRPGPVQGDMVHPYLRRRLGEEPITYLHPRLKPALQETLGVILFQEQILKVTRDLARFSAGQGEQMRRALGSKNPEKAVEAFHEAFISGAVQNDVDVDTAELVFEKLKAFGGYSFPKSHAAAFAVLVYRSAWLKRYHPVAFYTALLSHQPMGFWSPTVIVHDARRHGIRVLPVDTNKSQSKCAIEVDAIRIGFNYVTGFSNTTSHRIVQCRESGGYADLQDFCQRTRLPRRLVEHLILAGALDAWGKRRQLLWQLGLIQYKANDLNLEFPDEAIDLPELSDLQATDLAYSMTGVATDDHIMAGYRSQLLRQGF